MRTWIKDANGNRCSVEYWGSKEEAQKALDSLKNCSDCLDCSRCSRCSVCSDCSRCSVCSGCSRCSDCSDLKNASRVEAGSAQSLAGPPVVPILDNIHQRVYEAAANPKALDMSQWHTCTKTHCRAGWIVALAGKAGKALEQFYDTPLAAMKIYDASSPLPKVSPVRFLEPNGAALSDMKRMAEMEAAALGKSAP